MADSIPASWICNYLIDIAENHGGQLLNAPFFSKKKRVQLIDFLTFYEDSYVWAWASDKSHRIPIRISKEGVQEYKVQSHGRNVIDCRFAVVFISNFRPIFAPRPLGGTLKGNTTVSHIALEVGHVGVIGHGGHMFGDPKDVESNAPVKEWVAGLRQDGGGGNILKLRKQERQAAVQQTSAPTRLCQPTSPKLDSVLAATATKPVANEQLQAPACPQRPVDFKREYKKRWRAFTLDRWKFACRPQQETPTVTGAGLSTTTQERTEDLHSIARPAPRTPSPRPPEPSHCQGTPTEWSVSPQQSPVQQVRPRSPPSHDVNLDVSAPCTQGDSEKCTLTAKSVQPASRSQTHSPQPPTPAQRDRTVISPKSQSQLQSSPVFPSSSLPLTSPLTALRKDIKRKVPHPKVPALVDPNHSGPTQILVPNSDTSGTTSSQPQSQPPHTHVLSQQSQPYLHAPPFPSSLSNGFKPGDTSTPRKPSVSSHTSSPGRGVQASPERMVGQGELPVERPSASQGLHSLVDEDKPTHDSLTSSSLFALPWNARHMKNPTEQGHEVVQNQRPRHGVCSTADNSLAQGDDGSPLDGVDVRGEVVELSDDDAETHAELQKEASSCVTGRKCVPSEWTNTVDRPPVLSSPSSMHSLFSSSPSVSTNKGLLQDIVPIPVAQGSVVPDSIAISHDPEAWKQPSFMRVHEGKGRATGPDLGLSSEIAGKKRKGHQRHTPPQKRTKTDDDFDPKSQTLQDPILQAQQKLIQPRETGALGDSAGAREIRRSAESHCAKEGNGLAISQGTGAILSQKSQRHEKMPRLAGVMVDFTHISCSPNHLKPQMSWNDLKKILLRTGRIRTLGDVVVRDGSVYFKTE